MIYFEIPVICPACGSPTEVRCTQTAEILFCTNPDCCGSALNRIEHFGSKKAMNIKGLSKSTIEKLLDWGWVKEIADLYELHTHRQEWIDKDGFGEKSVDKLLQAIEDSRTCALADFLCGIGIPFIGKTLSPELAAHFDSYADFRKAVDEKFDFTQFDKIAIEKNNAILNFNYAEADRAAQYLTLVSAEEPETANTLSDEKICVTGKLNSYTRDEITKKIESLGGKVVSSVTKNTTWLLTNTPDSGTSKNVAAQRLGIPIITEEEFSNMYF